MISYKNQKTMSNKVDSIVEGNKLIAFFMGAEALEGTKEFIWYREYFLGKKSWKPSGLKYHTSWDWLIPACNKWDRLSLVGQFQYEDLCDELDNAMCLYDIEKVYSVLVKCLEWLKLFQDVIMNPALPLYLNQNKKQ